MINKDLINNLPNTTGIFHDIVISEQKINNFTVLRNSYNNLVELHDKSMYPYSMIMIDACNFIKLYGKRLMEIDYNSVLFVGLGLGIFPYLSQDTTLEIDVVEINEDIITMCNNINHLKPNVNIINADIYNFVTDKKYDLIVFDIWNEKSLNFTQQTEELTALFANNLTLNGEVHFPLLNF